MGSKRVGLARLEALMENLKRDLNLSGSTIRGAQIQSNTYTFGQPPVVLEDAGTLVDGGNTDTVIHQYADGLQLHMTNIGGQTIDVPAAHTGGLVYTFDAANNEGIQWVTRMNTHKGTLNKDYFVCGSATNKGKLGTSRSPAFYMEMKFEISDVSDTDDCAFGFRKVEASQAAIDDYDEMACLNVIAGDIKIETILNGGGTTTTDTTDNWGDYETHTLKVLVSNAGVVTYEIDGAAPTTTAAFTFDEDEAVTPFGFFLNDGTGDPKILYKELSFGLQ